MARVSLTTSLIDESECPLGASKLDLFDTACVGLMVEVRPTGRKTYYFRYINDRRRQRQHRIGDARDLSLDLARKLVQKLRTRVALGEDLLEVKRERANTPTVSAFIAEKYLPFVKSYKRSWKNDDGLLQKHIVPSWGRRFMDEIVKDDVLMLMARHRKTHAAGSCNRLLILIRYVFSLALKWETPGLKLNPTDGVPLLQENNRRERYLSAEESRRLYAAVCESENSMLRFIIPMLILTGARKREALDARW